MGLFLDDGILDTGSLGIHRGKQELRKFAASLPPSPAWRHLINNEVIRIEGASARALSYVTILDVSQASPAIIYAGCYIDELVKRDEQWLLRKRAALTSPAQIRDI